MKVALVTIIYRGVLDRVEVFSTTRKATDRYYEILKEYGLKEQINQSDYDIILDQEVVVQ